jgi:CarD family transcriptional regulator
LIEEIPQIEVLLIPQEKGREAQYKEALMKNQCRNWVEIIKTSYLHKKKRQSMGKKMISADERYMNIAENFLYGELALALGTSKEDVKKRIISMLDSEIEQHAEAG